MADEEKKKKSSSGNPFEELATFLVIILLAGAILSHFGSAFKANPYLNLISSGGLFSPYQPLTTPLVSGPIGSAFQLLSPASLFNTVGGLVSGSKAAGDHGTVIGGPEFKDGERYWLVQFSDGTSGWVADRALGNAAGGPLDEGNSAVGDPVVTTADIGVADSPGGSVSGTESKGGLGSIGKGPLYANGERYWYVDFRDGRSGWVPEHALGDVGPATFTPGATPVGASVITQGKTAVSDTAGGSPIDYQPDGSPGTITEGPVSFAGTNYYYVKFQHGTSGFVAEGNLTDERGQAITTGKTADGSTVMLIADSDVAQDPGGVVVGTQKGGAVGVVSGSPVLFNGARYWYVKFWYGPSGYVPESVLRDTVAAPFNPGDTLVGTSVYPGVRTPVYDSPGGTIIGYQKEGAHGVVIQGPIYFNGARYWQVDFDTGPDGYVSGNDLTVKATHPLLVGFITLLRDLGTFVALLLLTAIIYTLIRISQVFGEYRRQTKIEAAKTRVQTEISHPRWEKVLDHLSAENPNEWRLAILEADIILGEMLDKMGYGKGATIGERLKTIEESDFRTIDKAWEAHKARNMIAHEGSDYVLTQREAKRIVSLYEEVFHEFRYI